jgi:hypothetical protein
MDEGVNSPKKKKKKKKKRKKKRFLQSLRGCDIMLLSHLPDVYGKKLGL